MWSTGLASELAGWQHPVNCLPDLGQWIFITGVTDLVTGQLMMPSSRSTRLRSVGVAFFFLLSNHNHQSTKLLHGLQDLYRAHRCYCM